MYKDSRTSLDNECLYTHTEFVERKPNQNQISNQSKHLSLTILQFKAQIVTVSISETEEPNLDWSLGVCTTSQAPLHCPAPCPTTAQEKGKSLSLTDPQEELRVPQNSKQISKTSDQQASTQQKRGQRHKLGPKVTDIKGSISIPSESPVALKSFQKLKQSLESYDSEQLACCKCNN